MLKRYMYNDTSYIAIPGKKSLTQRAVAYLSKSMGDESQGFTRYSERMSLIR